MLAASRPTLDDGGKTCWFEEFSWKFPPHIKPIAGHAQLELRSLPGIKDRLLVALRIDSGTEPFNRERSVYSENCYWISTLGKAPLRLAGAGEWDAAKELKPSHNRCPECKPPQNGALSYKDWRFTPKHAEPHTWKSPYASRGLDVDQSPDGNWLVLHSWDGYQWRTGGDIISGFSAGVREFIYWDMFDLQTGRRAVTFGGLLKNNKNDMPNFFLNFDYIPSWLAPHYLVGVLTPEDRSMLFCNPQLSEASK